MPFPKKVISFFNWVKNIRIVKHFFNNENYMEESAYIKCLKKGYECDDDGISYIEMVKYLEDNNYKITENFHKHFFIWFFDNFYYDGITLDRLWIRDVQRQVPWRFDKKLYEQPHQWFTDKCPMTFEARQKYIDYLLLKESSKKSAIANRVAFGAIIITGIIGATQIFFQIFPISSTKEECKYKRLEQNLSKPQITTKDTTLILYHPKQDSSIKTKHY